MAFDSIQLKEQEAQKDLLTMSLSLEKVLICYLLRKVDV